MSQKEILMSCSEIRIRLSIPIAKMVRKFSHYFKRHPSITGSLNKIRTLFGFFDTAYILDLIPLDAIHSIEKYVRLTKLPN